MPPYAYFEKKFVPLSEARVGVVTHAFNYGTGCFEGIRGNWNAEEGQTYLFRVKEHYERLRNSCRVLKIDLPYTVEELREMTVEVVRRNGYHEDIYVRPLAYKSAQAVGVRCHDLTDDLVIFVVPFGNYLDVEKGITCGTSSWRRIDDNMIPARAKITGLYVNSALAKTEAQENGFDEAIMLTHDGHVSEGSGENLFIVAGGKLVTPSPSDNILLGITRDTIIKIAKNELGIDTVERQIDRSELYLADECFLTGTAAHVSPVLAVDHRDVADGQIGPITKKLQTMYFDIVRGKNSKYANWCTAAYPQAAKAKA